MVYFEINKKNFSSGTPTLIDKLNKHLTQKNNKVFVLFFMEGCGPCNATRPEWTKLKNVLSSEFIKRPDVVIVSIDHELAGKLKNIGTEPNGFPTMRYLENKGVINENYEDANIEKKDRTIDSFIEWIKLKTGENNITTSEARGGFKQHKSKSYFKKRQNGGKWTRKHKRSIRCKNPRGFSRKQYCKYGRK
jgi:thiol-disulfide isomerase/thioredoxin